GRVVIQRPFVTPAGLKRQGGAAFPVAALRGPVQGCDDPPRGRVAVEIHADEVLYRPALLAGVKPAQGEARIDAELLRHELAPGAQTVSQRQPADAVAVVPLELILARVATVEPAPEFPGASPGVVGAAEAETVAPVR